MLIQTPASSNLEQWQARRQQAETLRTEVGATAPDLDAQLERHDARLLDLVDSRDRYFDNGRKVSEGMIKGGIALLVVAVLAESALGAGQTVTYGLMGAGLGLAGLSIPVNMSRSVMLEVRRGQLQKTGQEKLVVLEKRQKLATAEAELAAYDSVVGETERMLQSLSKGGGSAGRLGDSVYFNGIRVRSARR